jgi:hypothetical protein
MIPPTFDPTNPSPGERVVFEALRDDPLTATWTVLHSQDIAHHIRQDRGECDFVVMIPGKGILCLEVKGHRRIARQSGNWIFGDLDHGGNVEQRGPFKQANEAMESIRKRVKSYAEFAGVPFQWMAVFPFVETVQRLSTDECLPWQIVSATELREEPLSVILLSASEAERVRLRSVPNARWFNSERLSPTPKQIDRISALLRPDFEFCETPASIRRRRADELRRYTSEQFQALDRMEGNSRILFDGLAGTGKTLLALECARREAILGARVLLLCFNRPLREWLEHETESFGIKIDVRTVSQLCRQIVASAGQLNEFNDVEFERQTELALESLLERGSQGTSLRPYDIVVIDEAQDVMQEDFLDVLDLLLRNGLTKGRWRAFGDFANQAIYDAERAGIHRLEERGISFSAYSLRENCRNTPIVARLVESLGALPDGQGYTRILRPQNRFEPHNDFYDDLADQHDLLALEVSRLLDEFEPREIVILSTMASGSAASTINSSLVEVPFSEQLNDDNNVIRYSTIHRFKGLDSPAVILTDIEDVTSDRSRSLLYVGMSRATDQLSTLVSKSVREDFREIVLRGAK